MSCKPYTLVLRLICLCLRPAALLCKPSIAAMESLRKSVLFYRTAKPSSEPYKLKFGDWTSFKALLQEAAEAFRSGSSEASRLREISLCSDSKSEELFNKEDVSCLIKKGVDIIHKEFFPDLPAVENEEYWNARKKRKINPNEAGI